MVGDDRELLWSVGLETEERESGGRVGGGVSDEWRDDDELDDDA